MNRKKNIILIGFMGSGKTTFGRWISTSHSMKFIDTDEYIDFVGTGGDGANSFNISTTSMFVCAAAGVTVAKHGNRAASSKSGASDLLEALGANIMLEPKQVEQCINETGMGLSLIHI